MPAAKRARPAPASVAVAPPAAPANRAQEKSPDRPHGALAAGECRDLDRLIRTEWLLTNGLGGFAMGTASGIPTRRYHGLLIGATMPPVGRVLALSATVDTIEFVSPSASARAVPLSSFRFKGPPLAPAVTHPDGASRLVGFEAGESVVWRYRVDDLAVTRELVLADGSNACALRYSVQRSGEGGSPAALRLRVRPLVALRDMHALVSRVWHDRFVCVPRTAGVRLEIDGQRLELAGTVATFHPAADWWHNLFYQIEQERGQDCFEDLFSPGEFVLDVPASVDSATCTLSASLNSAPEMDVDAALRSRRARVDKALNVAIPEPLRRAMPADDQRAASLLVRAADAFVVARGEPSASPAASTLTSIIAGYPWFSDWGRDTCISLPGLLLVTGRYEQAFQTLTAFANARKNGIIPNLFDDRTGHAEHNTVDASLWFILAARQYLAKSADRAGFDRELLPACLDIVSWYRRGTMHNIAMDPMDKLITAGSESTQLTWMDARRDGVVFTPRFGKPVEINALWCAALTTIADAMGSGDVRTAAGLRDLAAAARSSFRQTFWDAERGCLFDRLTPTDAAWRPINEMRPNQIFAISLPGSPLSPEQQRSVLSRVREELLTPYGLRTLAQGEEGYQARYEGSMFERDRAYHNGTVWPWLLGPYAEAVLRVGEFSPAARAEARSVLGPLLSAMAAQGAGEIGGCIGQVAEIFDAEPPRRPQGCAAQAWSVAELLRVLVLSWAD